MRLSVRKLIIMSGETMWQKRCHTLGLRDMRFVRLEQLISPSATLITLGLRPWVIWVALAWQIPCHASHHVTTNNVRYWRTIEKSHNHVTRLYMTLMRGIVQSTNSFNFSAYIPVQLLKAYIYQLSQLFRGDILKGSGSNKQLLPKIRTLKEEVIDFAKMVLCDNTLPL